MSKAQETKTRIIAQAATLFNQQGYTGTSVSDLMRATGLQKGGIYNHFHSKDELALEAFDFAVNCVQQKFMGALPIPLPLREEANRRLRSQWLWEEKPLRSLENGSRDSHVESFWAETASSIEDLSTMEAITV
jgi:AcrR family transcriptional regulator